MNNYLLSRRKELGLTMREVAEAVGVSEATVSRWEHGQISNMRSDRVAAYADILNIDPVSLVNGQFKEASPLQTPSKYPKIPVFQKIQAGCPTMSPENIVDYEEVSLEMAACGELFALKIKGSGMEPRISEGDVVIVKKQSAVNDGDYAVMAIGGGEAMVRRFYQRDSGITLVPSNSKYDPLFFTTEELEKNPLTILGRVIELRAKF